MPVNIASMSQKKRQKAAESRLECEISHSRLFLNLLRDGEDSFSCMWIPCPGGRDGSSSTISPHEVL